jgi:hypothetical protein
MNSEDLAMAIMSGQYDADLDTLTNVIRERRKQQEQVKGMFLRPGDRVCFNDKVRPKYLRGAQATVVKVNKTRAVIQLDDKTGRFGTGNTNAPFAIIDKVTT